MDRMSVCLCLSLSAESVIDSWYRNTETGFEVVSDWLFDWG